MSTISETIGNYISNPSQIFSDAEAFLTSEPATQNILATDSYATVAQSSLPIGIPPFLILPMLFSGCKQTECFNSEVGDEDSDGYLNQTCAYEYEEFHDNSGTYVDVDCNDHDASIHPGVSEICDGVDQNCNFQVDEDLPKFVYYQDKDSDGYGCNGSNADPCEAMTACEGPAGYVNNYSDCDDNDPDMSPSSSDIFKDCLSEDSSESGPTFIECDQSIQAAITSETDFDHFYVTLDKKSQIGGSLETEQQNVVGLLFDLYQEQATWDSTWIEGQAHVKIGVDSEGNGLNYGKDLSYLLHVTCNECASGIDDHTACADENSLWMYDECNDPVRAVEDCAGNDICYDDSCCDPTYFYYCEWDGGMSRWALTKHSDCYTDGGTEVYSYCASDQVCVPGDYSVNPPHCEDL